MAIIYLVNEQRTAVAKLKSPNKQPAPMKEAVKLEAQGWVIITFEEWLALKKTIARQEAKERAAA